MYPGLQILSVMLVAVAMALSLAHALEFPGKLRLSETEYRAVQPIYYPGFTIGALSEPLGMLSLLLLAVFTPREGLAFWLIAAALALLIAMHAVYWLVTHPVNKVWLKDTKVSGAGGRFFGVGGTQAPKLTWEEARDRWEYSHVARAALSVGSLLLLVTAMAV